MSQDINSQWTVGNVGSYETVDYTDDGKTINIAIVPFNIDMDSWILLGTSMAAYTWWYSYNYAKSIVTRIYYKTNTNPKPNIKHIPIVVLNAISDNIAINATNQYLSTVFIGWPQQ